MWIYEKKLEFPVKITQPDARLAKIMIEQYGGADGRRRQVEKPVFPAQKNPPSPEKGGFSRFSTGWGGSLFHSRRSTLP